MNSLVPAFPIKTLHYVLFQDSRPTHAPQMVLFAGKPLGIRASPGLLLAAGSPFQRHDRGFQPALYRHAR